MAADDSNYQAIDNVSNYQAGTSIHDRLTSFVPSDAAEDTKRLCFLRIEGDDVDGLMKDLVNLEAYDTKVLPGILAKMNGTGTHEGSTGYAQFSITAMSDSREEKMQIMKTNGDSFIATFTGRNPHIVGFSGNLIFDYAQEASWYHAFINAYEYFLRASRMAKHRCKARVVMPDCQEYVGYIINLTTNHDADNDMVIPMSFSLLVVDKTPSRPNTFATDTAKSGTAAKAKDVIDGTIPDDPDKKAMEELSEHIPTYDEYQRHNELKTRIDNGEEISEDETTEYNTITDKINNQGQYRTEYNETKLKYYSRLSGEGKLDDSQANDLIELQEAKYYQLMEKQTTVPVDKDHPYGGLSEDEYKTYQDVALKASADAQKRALLEKQSAGLGLTPVEQQRLNELQDVDIYTADSLKAYQNVPNNTIETATGKGYDPVAQPDTPASEIVQYAEKVPDTSPLTKNNVVPDKRLADEVVKAPAVATITNKEVSEANTATPARVQEVSTGTASHSVGDAADADPIKEPAPVLQPTTEEVSNVLESQKTVSATDNLIAARQACQDYQAKVGTLIARAEQCLNLDVYTPDHIKRLKPAYKVDVKKGLQTFAKWQADLERIYDDSVSEETKTAVVANPSRVGQLTRSIDYAYRYMTEYNATLQYYWFFPDNCYVFVKYDSKSLIEAPDNQY